MITTLEKLGLSEKEAKVYLAALELGSNSVQNIAKKAQVNRATTYVVLESLAKKGLASSYDKGKKTFFIAETPEQLGRLLKIKEEEIDQRRQELNKLIPELRAIYNLSGSKPKVKFYEGKEGHEAMLQDSLRCSKNGDEVCAFTPLDIYSEFYPEYKESAVNNRVRSRIQMKVIYTNKKGPVENASDPQEMRLARYVPSEKFPFQSMISIGPGQVIRIYSYKDNFVGITIEDKYVFKTIKAVFDLAWEAAEKYN